ncbi:MAG: GNAT family N-acetyltransferase [Oscillospiraceae bacterium]|nr:GNAT family N-acetyltransferase [Oscillospiraceae bacterium]
MSIILAQECDLTVIKEISHATIEAIYPHYYPSGAVAFFLNHHSDENIKYDISNQHSFLCCNIKQTIVGTVTIRKNEILRLFVLPKYQGNGYGKELLDYAEKIIAESYNEILIDTSLSAKSIYLKRGYSEAEYHSIKTENGDYLCYDTMKKQI